MPDTMFLVPGYGAQGGDAPGSLAGVRSDGRGVLVSNSRGITAAWQHANAPDAWLDATRDALDRMNDELDAHR
jgi:orotidine-5'-phosphate decarboxylase